MIWQVYPSKSKYLKYCLPIADYVLAITSPNHTITHYLLTITYYLLTTIYRRRRDFVCIHPISSSWSSSGFTATVKDKPSHLGSVNTSQRALAQEKLASTYWFSKKQPAHLGSEKNTHHTLAHWNPASTRWFRKNQPSPKMWLYPQSDCKKRWLYPKCKNQPAHPDSLKICEIRKTSYRTML